MICKVSNSPDGASEDSSIPAEEGVTDSMRSVTMQRKTLYINPDEYD